MNKIKKLVAATAMIGLTVVPMKAGAFNNETCSVRENTCKVAVNKIPRRTPSTSLHGWITSDCGEVRWLYKSGLRNARGISAWCAGHVWWYVYGGCSKTPGGPVGYKLVGPRATRWPSEAWCPSYYPYAVTIGYGYYG
jgi:hypothetical protein